MLLAVFDLAAAGGCRVGPFYSVVPSYLTTLIYLEKGFRKRKVGPIMRMKKKVDKNEELFYRVSITEAFQNAILEARKELGIPSEGLKDDEEFENWLARNEEEATRRYYAGLPEEMAPINKSLPISEKIIKNFGLPVYFPIRNYILRNKFFMPDEPYGCTLMPTYSPADSYYFNKVEGYSVILVHPKASQRDVVEFVKNKWSEFPQSKNTSRIKSKIYKERDALIHSKHLEGKNEYQIREELQSEYGWTVDSDHIRKIVHQEKKARNKPNS